MSEKPAKKQWKDYTPAERFVTIAFITLVLMGLGAMAGSGGSKSGGTTTPTMSRSDCYDMGQTPTEKASNDDVVKFMHECGQYYGGATTTINRYGY